MSRVKDIDPLEVVIHIQSERDGCTAIDYFKKCLPRVMIGTLPKVGDYYGVNDDNYPEYNLSYSLPSVVGMKRILTIEEINGDLTKLKITKP